MKWTYRALLWAADLIYPNRCPVCGSFIEYDGTVCESCLDSLEFISDRICPNCGMINCICSDMIHYDRCVCFVSYSGKARNGIIALKNSVGANFARYFAGEARTYLTQQELLERIDIVTAVPSTKAKLREKGMNHAAVFAKYICRECGLSFDQGLLVKSEKALEQHTLSAEERRVNAIDSYSFGRGDVKGSTVLLCDDVVTTGGTFNACAKALKDNGAKNVICCAIAGTNLKSGKTDGEIGRSNNAEE